MKGETRTLSRDALTALAAGALAGCGVDRAAAEDTADILVLGEMMGLATHGVRRVLSYGERARGGGINPRARIRCDAPAPGLRLIDGDNGLGPAIGARALREAQAAAREAGLAAAFCRRSNHFGPIAPYLWLAARDGFAAIIGSNATPMMAPAGGRKARIGNNPLGAGIPSPGGDPIILDMAMSVVSRSRIREAAETGEPIPEGWACDLNGRPTTDAAIAVDGLLSPIGGYKGAGLALCVDLLAGLWSGAAFLTQVKSLSAKPEAAQDLGQVFIVIDTRRLMPQDQAAARMAEFGRLIRETPPADSAAPVRLPGERAIARLRRAEAEGVTLEADLFEALVAMSG